MSINAPVTNRQDENMAYAKNSLEQMEAAAKAIQGSGGRDRTKNDASGQKMTMMEAFYWSRWDKNDDLS